LSQEIGPEDYADRVEAVLVTGGVARGYVVEEPGGAKFVTVIEGTVEDGPVLLLIGAVIDQFTDEDATRERQTWGS
jgi:hypothetical protein